MRLNILIPTIPERHHKLERLLKELHSQVEKDPSPEQFNIIYIQRTLHKHGGPTIGENRQELLDKCPDDGYVCFIDDDDSIAPNYIEEISRAMEQEPDVITFNQLVTLDTFWAVCNFGLNNEIQEATPERIFKRPPFHICPVKTDYAKRYKFPATMYGEDWEWMSQVVRHCLSEYHINKIIHNYNHSQSWTRAE